MADQDDDDSDDDGYGRRNSKVKPLAGGTNGAAAPTRSLKGQETYKARVGSRASLSRAVGGSKNKQRHRDREEDRSFIGGILSDQQSSGELDDEPTPEELDSSGARDHDDALAYAMNLHATKSAPPATHSSHTHTHISHSHLRNHVPEAGPSGSRQPPIGHLQNEAQAQAYAMHLSGSTAALSAAPPPVFPNLANSSYYGQSFPNGSFVPSYNYPMPAALPPTSQASGWNREALARYAEMRLQEDHRRRHMQLLERQRQQLTELGIPVDDNSLLDHLFGGGGGSGSGNQWNASSNIRSAPTPGGQAYQSTQPTSFTPMSGQAQTGFTGAQESFIWPTLSASGGAQGTNGTNTPGLETGVGPTDRTEFAPDAEFIWPGTETGLLPSPASMQDIDGKKRDRDRERDENGVDKRVRV